MGRKKANHVHEYVTFDPETDISKCLVEGCTANMKGSHSSNLIKHFATRHPDVFQEILEKNQKAGMEKQASSYLQSLPIFSKKKRQYEIARQACIDLVKIHGHPVSLIDDKAFQTILHLISMKTDEKAMLTSNKIEAALTDQEVGNCEKDNQDDAEDSKNSDSPHRKRTIKGEAPQCTCNADDDDEDTPHRPECAVVHAQTYFTANFEDESYDDAAQDSSIASHEEMEEVYLDVDFMTKSAEPPKKRLKTNMTDPIKRNNTTDDAIKYSIKKNKQEEMEDPAQVEKTMDRFGLYIASLMKPLPRIKRVKFQSQIVQRLLQEQATYAA